MTTAETVSITTQAAEKIRTRVQAAAESGQALDPRVMALFTADGLDQFTDFLVLANPVIFRLVADLIEENPESSTAKALAEAISFAP